MVGRWSIRDEEAEDRKSRNPGEREAPCHSGRAGVAPKARSRVLVAFLPLAPISTPSPTNKQVRTLPRVPRLLRG